MNSNGRQFEQVGLLSTALEVKRFTRDKWLSQALDHARLAKELHDEDHLREAVRLRDLAEGLTAGIERNERDIERMRESLA